MNIENVKRLAGQAEEYSVTTEPAIYCDGNIMCLSGDMKPNAWRWGQKAAEFWGKTLAEPGDVSVLVAAEMRGKFPCYVRYFRSESITVAIKEQFRRCFDEDAEFRGSDREKKVIVFEGGSLVGIVMPIQTWAGPNPIDALPVIPFVDDDAIYHQCESE